MRIPFPADVERINVTDYDVLRALHRHGPLWKMEITRRVNACRGREHLLDVQDSITKQAVSKRVDRLHELDYVGTAIIAVDEVDAGAAINRDLIIGYTLTEKGEDALEDATCRILGDVLRTALVGEPLPADVTDYVDQYCALNDIPVEDVTLQDIVAVALDGTQPS